WGNLCFKIPYNQVPVSAAKITIIIEYNPEPNNTKTGSGQAPINAQPNPNEIPPNKLRLIDLWFGMIGIVFSSISFAYLCLIICIVMTPINNAEPLKPYI